MSDNEIAIALRKTLKTCGSPVKFPTNPNAPFVTNRLEIHHGRRHHNTDPWRAKYSADAEGAEWMRKTMNAASDLPTVWYVVE